MIRYSVFRSVTDLKSLDARSETWPELVARIRDPETHRSKAACPLIKLATFGDRVNAKGSLRVDANVDQVFGVEGDYDGNVISAAEAAARLRAARVRAVIYTSATSGVVDAKRNPHGGPRWRVLAPLSGPVAPELRAELVSVLNAALGGVLGAESWVLAQTYYFGAVEGVEYEVHAVEGETLDLHAAFGDIDPVGPPVAVRKAAKLDKPRRQSDADEEEVAWLDENQWVTGFERDGRVDVRCPWADGHSTDSGPSSTSYFPAGVSGFALGHFRCLHASCSGRTDGDFFAETGLDKIMTRRIVAAFPGAAEIEAQIAAIIKAKAARFEPSPWHAFAGGASPSWIVRGVLPQAELCVIYGESGGGKTFFALDLVGAVARGIEWRGRRVQQGRVVYICAEGVAGFRKRVQAYAQANGLAHDAMSFDVIADAPDLLSDDHKALSAAIGLASIVVVDTLAQATPGANENSGEDMGKALAHCKALHRATGALIVLIHHSGKDAARGARGWSGLKGACDAEIEVTRAKDTRAARISKQKDGEEGDVLPFKLHPVLLGLDEDGQEVTSCTVGIAEQAPAKREGPRGKVQQLVLHVAHDAMGTGARMPESALICQAVARLPEPEDDKPDRRRELVRQALTALIEGAFLCKEDDDIVIP